jgi:transcriptional antiterminator RfaH
MDCLSAGSVTPSDRAVLIPQAESDHFWYAIYTKPRQEQRALDNLSNQGYHCFLPTITVDKVKKNAVVAVQQPLFGRYLFIELSASTSNWMPIRSTKGVSNMVSFANKPARVPSDLIKALKTAPILVQHRFEPQQLLTIQSGAFAGLPAVFQRLVTAPDGESRALVLVELLHKQHTLSLPVNAF